MNQIHVSKIYQVGQFNQHIFLKLMFIQLQPRSTQIMSNTPSNQLRIQDIKQLAKAIKNTNIMVSKHQVQKKAKNNSQARICRLGVE